MMIMLNGVLILLALVITRVKADYGPYIQSAAYDEGKFGEWPTETYRSSPIVGPALNYLQYSDECKDGLYTFIAPRGNKVANPGPMILDQDGHLVWTKLYGQSYNLNVYTFKGQDYLTFWVGNDGVGGHGEGAYYMVGHISPFYHHILLPYLPIPSAMKHPSPHASQVIIF